ncbi:MAG: hypothetical protein J6T06_12390 [Victivallales bacterium]|nr:hypothetical protein [Victivallales bacterium]
MPPIETIVRPRRNRICVSVPKEYSSYSFQVILVPLMPVVSHKVVPGVRTGRKPRTLVDALMACPKLDDGEEIDISRDDDAQSFFERSGAFDSENFA